MKQDSLLDLANVWIKDAKFLREHGASEAAVTSEKHAREVVKAVSEAEDETLTLAEAAAESGYARRTIRQKVATGEIPNVGRKNAPRIRRGDLPRKAGAASNGFDAGAEARAITGAGR